MASDGYRLSSKVFQGGSWTFSLELMQLSDFLQLFTRRRDIKSPFPRTADPVTEVSDIADATAKKLQNLRANAPNADGNVLAVLPETPIETGMSYLTLQFKTACTWPPSTAFSFPMLIRGNKAFYISNKDRANGGLCTM